MEPDRFVLILKHREDGLAMRAFGPFERNEDARMFHEAEFTIYPYREILTLEKPPKLVGEEE